MKTAHNCIAWAGFAAAGFAAALGATTPALAQDDDGGPIEYVRVCDVYGSGFFYIPGTETCLKIGGYVRYQNEFIGGDAGIGTVVTTGDPLFARAPTRLDGWGIGSSIDFTTGTWLHSIGLDYASGSATTEAHEPDGGFDIGYVPGDAGLGAGSNLGNFGADAWSTAAFRRWSLSYEAQREFNLDGGFNWGPPGDYQTRPSRKWAGVTTSLRVSNLDYDGHLERTPDPDFVYFDNALSLQSTEFAIGPTISGRHNFNPNFYVSGQAALQGVLRYSRLDGIEYLCGGCGGAPTVATTEAEKTSVDFRASLQGSVGYQVTERLDLSLTGGVEYGGRDSVDMRHSPGDDSTGIGRSTGGNWHVGLRVQVQF